MKDFSIKKMVYEGLEMDDDVVKEEKEVDATDPKLLKPLIEKQVQKRLKEEMHNSNNPNLTQQSEYSMNNLRKKIVAREAQTGPELLDDLLKEKGNAFKQKVDSL